MAIDAERWWWMGGAMTCQLPGFPLSPHVSSAPPPTPRARVANDPPSTQAAPWHRCSSLRPSAHFQRIRPNGTWRCVNTIHRSHRL